MTTAAPILASVTAQKRRAALNSIVAATAMTLLKLVVGLLSGSLGVLSDAAHSGLDLIGAFLTFLSVRVSDKPADEDHTYGHGKIENVSAFIEAGLMAISSVWIIAEALSHIARHTIQLHHSIWPVFVLLLSIAVDYWRSRQLREAARRTGSPALETDAFHFASDIWATLAVLAGLGASWAGARFGIPWLQFADPFAAIVVSLMILRLTIHLTRKTIAELIDEIPAETRQRVIDAAASIDGVLAVEQARVRRSGASYFADLTLALPRRFTFEHTGEVVRAATEAVDRALPGTDVVIHTVPRDPGTESIFDRVRAVAARNNVSVHELNLHSHNGRLRVEQHVELDERLPLIEAHRFVTALEDEILHEAPEIDSVLTHIESEPATIEQPEEIVLDDQRIEQALRSAASHSPEIIDVHEITVLRVGDHIDLSCHCTLPDELPMGRVHEIITALEDRLKQEYPDVNRTTIHPEPATENTR
jgi:cation diffusion facilitator family transporter